MSTTIKLHARKSASGSDRWTLCPGSVREESGKPNMSNAAADWGTVAHDLAEHVLRGDDEFLASKMGRRAFVQSNGTVLYAVEHQRRGEPQYGIAVDDEMAETVMSYVTFVRDLADKGSGTLLVEERLSIEHLTGELNAKGTSDAVLLFSDELCITDLKGGFLRVLAKYPQPDGNVKPNTQLTMYASAVFEEYAHLYDWQRVRIVVCQPRLKHIDEHVMTIAEFQQWCDWIKERARATESPDAPLVPGEKQCQFCKAFPCQAAERLALETAIDDFEDKPADIPSDAAKLGRLKALVPVIRQFCNSVEQRVRAELEAGRSVDGWKLVDGDEGDRKWKDELAAVVALGNAGLTADDYTKSELLSVAQIEKLTKGKQRKLSKDAWFKLQDCITRDPGAPKVVPASDPRPVRAVNPADDFDNEANADFF